MSAEMPKTVEIPEFKTVTFRTIKDNCCSCHFMPSGYACFCKPGCKCGGKCRGTKDIKVRLTAKEIEEKRRNS